jgi:hypothetical protein
LFGKKEEKEEEEEEGEAMSWLDYIKEQKSL